MLQRLCHWDAIYLRETWLVNQMCILRVATWLLRRHSRSHHILHRLWVIWRCSDLLRMRQVRDSTEAAKSFISCAIDIYLCSSPSSSYTSRSRSIKIMSSDYPPSFGNSWITNVWDSFRKLCHFAISSGQSVYILICRFFWSLGMPSRHRTQWSLVISCS